MSTVYGGRRTIQARALLATQPHVFSEKPTEDGTGDPPCLRQITLINIPGRLGYDTMHWRNVSAVQSDSIQWRCHHPLQPLAERSSIVTGARHLRDMSVWERSVVDAPSSIVREAQRIAYTRGKRVCIRTVLPSWWGESCFRCPFDLGSSTGNEVTLVFCEGHPTAPCILRYHQSWYSCDFRVIYSGLVHVLFVPCSPSSTTVVDPNPRSLQWNG